ncbi:MlaA family lipoprotein [Cereibacter sphaeroides]|uniref:MlaA family lipoprotein n=1 Tax=Cereibacter sphaeroides TaxID=1063 RepID=UPI000191C8DF|nr:VacJ family lipoprotein [Cereibacter sphaeroides]ACM02123.1 VacJ family lipoprotein precursor [Cereibacter sphaeroides KD131]EKX59236.1 Lipoprotein VacJ [Rhodobacter sp. AKP1]MWP36295.1 VacJ family lipoprotein [Cereibacter sphaeroides]RHZ92084.1 VacJ family lipoprotein [Cereibacter sphaeroides]
MEQRTAILRGCRIAAHGALFALLGAFVSACAGSANPTQAINDPDEADNRQIHEFNKSVDKAVLRPASRAYAVLPDPVERGINNFADNLDLPGETLNSLLQGRPGAAVENAARFVVNTTIGIGGLFDPAHAMGIEGRNTDFGETLYVWGANEGVYGEVPFLGPRTERDLVGDVVDVALNPLRLIVPSGVRTAGRAAEAGSILGDRARYSETIDSVLYESADSYSQTRLLYLQNRRFELGQTGGADDAYIDPYAIDPYEEFDAQ